MPNTHAPPHTRVAHRFFEFILFADHWGLHVTEYRDEAIAAYHARTNTTHHFVADWYQFRRQAPTHVPTDIVEAIVTYYQRGQP